MMRFHVLQFVAEKCAFNDFCRRNACKRPHFNDSTIILLFFFFFSFFVERGLSTNLMALVNSFPAFESFIWISCSY